MVGFETVLPEMEGNQVLLSFLAGLLVIGLNGEMTVANVAQQRTNYPGIPGLEHGRLL